MEVGIRAELGSAGMLTLVSGCWCSGPLPRRGLKSVSPRGYQSGQSWLWWAVTSPLDRILAVDASRRYYRENLAGVRALNAFTLTLPLMLCRFL